MRRILLVEDNPDDAELLRLLLVRFGHVVRLAGTGGEGLALAKEWAPDLVISDLGLPNLDGFALAMALRQTGVRLIAVSGAGDTLSHRMARESGYEACLTKPVSLDTVQRLIGV
jgi:two-component system CheB/CheR fusion protein